MASEPHSGQSNSTSAGAADAHIAPWASKWDALPEPVGATVPASLRADTAKIAPAPHLARPEPARGLFASKVMAGISALSFVLLALLAVACWPDIARLVG